ncbi:MAG: acyl-CoA dehydrogenase [Gammaproteobacteria bacterium]|nr:acyl-CoA dehydrogenase [Gammaproteobacteria bacterium]
MSLPTEEQTILRDMANSWVSQHAPVSALRALRDSGNELCLDPDTVSAVAQMGWTGTLIPEVYGGSDVGYRAMGVVLEELGRTLVAAPLISSAVGAVSALKNGANDTQKSAWLPAIANGSAIGALAIDETAHFAPQSIMLKAESSGSGYTFTGKKIMVHEGMSAHLLIVAARTSGEDRDDGGVTLFAVPAKAPGIHRIRRQLLDSRGYADITFAGTQVDGDAVLGTVDAGRDLLSHILDCAAAAVAAEALGVALQAFDTTLQYLKTRTQFGQLIGSFQALQHRAAKMFTDIQLARPTVYAALDALDAGAQGAAMAASHAKTTANELVHHISREMIQMHGGIGMTDAYDAGFYIKRARALEAAFGTSSYHRERYGRLHGI